MADELMSLNDVLAKMRASTAAGDGAEIGPTLLAGLLAHIDAQGAEIERLRDMLQKARDGLSCGLWDYGPGQSEHDQCDELLAEIDEMLKGGAA